MTEADTQAPSLPALPLGALQRYLQQSEPWSGLPALEVRLLLMQALHMSRVALLTRDHEVPDAAQRAQLAALLARRLAGEPVAYILGEREFFGLNFQLNPAVLIPRPETELLVELALRLAPPQARVLDLGTGSGAIAIALAHTRPDLQVTATDFSAPALAVAQMNAERLLPPGSLQLLHGDWYQALPAPACFDLIVSNPPYIEQNDPHLQQGDLRFEPQTALTDHADGLQALRTISAGAPAHLRRGCWLLMEHGYDQAPRLRELLQVAGWLEVQSWTDLAGIERVTGGRLA